MGPFFRHQLMVGILLALSSLRAWVSGAMAKIPLAFQPNLGESGRDMEAPEKLVQVKPVRRLSRLRMAAATVVAVAADISQFFFGAIPVAGILLDDIIDVIVMGVTMWLLGFHILLLPSFVLKLIPVADMLPTWTGCVIGVIALRKKAEKSEQFIDVSAETSLPKSMAEKSPAQLP